MSTDDERPETPAVPRTRAEMRAARDAEAAAAARSSSDDAPSRSLSEDGGADRDETRPAPREAAPESDPRFIPPAAPSTDPDPAPTPPRDRRFIMALAAVLGILVLVGAGLGVVSLTQGPRITETQVDPAQAIEASGSRMILTANQSLTAIDESQVTVEPAVPFTLDAAGRGIGIRFTVPLDDDTKYTVSIADVQGAGGGPSTTLTQSFTTPASNIFLLRRDAEGEDSIFRTDLTGE
jgi:hypothetical protein